MKVLQINSVCGIGSTGRISTDIHSILKDQGHESYIAYGRDLPKNCDNTIKIGTKFDNYAHVAKTRILDKHAFGSKKATIEFIKEVKELDPDIIHLHNIHGYYVNIEVLFNYLKEANKPVVWTLHDCWSFTGHCSHFDYIGCNKWVERCFDCPQKNEYPKSLLADNSKMNYKKKKELFMGINDMFIVTPSKWLARLVKKSFLGKYPVKVINNGIDLQVFTPTGSLFREKNHLNGKFIILGVASIWDYRKGLQYFIELSDRLNEDEIIVLVGLSEKQLKSVPNNIMGIMRTNSIEELAEIYSAADVFVNPTLEDNFPTTNLEALACGTPIITFDTGGSIESINDKTGIITEVKSAKGLIDAIRRIRKKVNMYKSSNCIKSAKENYDKDDKYQEYIELYMGVR